MMKPFVKLAILIAAAWLALTFTHELGHLIGGWCCGGMLREADLWPWHLPYSIFQPDPYPLVTLWAGPILGVAIPLVLAATIRTSWMRFIACSCLFANGVYLAAGWLWPERWLDTTRLLEHGAPPASIAIFCAATIVNGYIGLRAEWTRIFNDART